VLISPHEQPGRNDSNYDPLYKVRPVLDMCRHTFLDQYIPVVEVYTFFVSSWMFPSSMTGFGMSFSSPAFIKTSPLPSIQA